MLAEVRQILERGIAFAFDDYRRIAERPLGIDVKPKEDQLKCALYRAFIEAGHMVQVEGGYKRGRDKCDLMVAMREPVGLELKTAWAGDPDEGWQNKPDDQAKTWHKDLDKLNTLPAKGFGAGFFVLLLAYLPGSRELPAMRERVAKLGEPFIATEPRAIPSLNGLDTLECYAWRVF